VRMTKKSDADDAKSVTVQSGRIVTAQTPLAYGVMT
jgi:hypothetical protein